MKSQEAHAQRIPVFEHLEACMAGGDPEFNLRKRGPQLLKNGDNVDKNCSIRV